MSLRLVACRIAHYLTQVLVIMHLMLLVDLV